MKGLHSPSDEYEISNPVLLSCQDHCNGVGLQYTPCGERLQAALEVNNEEHGHFKYKTHSFVHLSLLLLLSWLLLCCYSNWDLQSI